MGRLNSLTGPTGGAIPSPDSSLGPAFPSMPSWPIPTDSKPAGSAEPSDPPAPPEATSPVGATDPSEGATPTETAQPPETTQATDPTQPAESTGSAKPAESSVPSSSSSGSGTGEQEGSQSGGGSQSTEGGKANGGSEGSQGGGSSESGQGGGAFQSSGTISSGDGFTSDGTSSEETSGTTPLSGAGGDTVTSTTIPADVPAEHSLLSGNTLLYGALILLIVLVACLAWLVLYQRKALLRAGRKRRNPVTVPTTGATATMAADVEKTAADPMAAAIPIAARQPIVAAAHQHIGAREDQQDSFGTSDLAAYPVRGVLAVVADGMGGLSNGGAVSSALVRSFLDSFLRLGSHAQPQDMLLEMTIQANAYITQMLRGTERSGSTLVSAVIRDGYLHFLTVGDSRIYLYRSGALLQLNREHIYQEELAVKAANRLISIPQVSGDRQAHSLTSYFGNGQIAALDRNYEGIKLLSGDRILLASDGVFGTLSQTQMEQALHGTVTEAAAEIGELIRDANQPYQDNNTALILEYRG